MLALPLKFFLLSWQCYGNIFYLASSTVEILLTYASSAIGIFLTYASSAVEIFFYLAIAVLWKYFLT
jgi:hypothetical protein